MKNIKYLFTFILFVMSWGLNAQTTNKLAVESITGIAGKEASIPIDLVNSQDIVAVQFNIRLPFPISGNNIHLIPERTEEHTASFLSLGGNNYTIVVVSMNNAAIRGNAGTLLCIPMLVDATVQPDEVYDITISDVVLSTSSGQNVASGSEQGKFTIQRVPTPDLIVEDVNFDTPQLSPNSTVSLNWKVKNIGTERTNSGWREKVFLISEITGKSLFIGSTYYDSNLGKGASVPRSCEFKIPDVIGFDGTTKAIVEIVPNIQTGELRADLANNTTTSTGTAEMGKLSYLKTSVNTVYEAETKSIKIKVSRSGDWSMDETFSLKSSAPNRIILPESITIPQGQSATYFYANIKANGVDDINNNVQLTIFGNKYPENSLDIIIIDDVYPTLNISTEAIDVTEGGKLLLRINVDHAPEEDLPVQLTCDYFKRFRIPKDLKILKGEKSVDVVVEAIEDNLPDIEQVITFKATAAQHNAGTLMTTLLDNDIPKIQLAIVPIAVSEAAGPLSVSATIKRTSNIDKRVDIQISDDSDNELYYANKKVEMPAGTSEITLNLGPIDNVVVDGERTYHITAAVYISSCDCNAQPDITEGTSTVPLTVYDNDGPTLSMKASSTVLKENDQIEVTVSRNTKTTQPLLVKLSGNYDELLEYPHEITIPSGKGSTSFIVKSKSNNVNGDDFTAVITATADNFAKGCTYFMVSDQTQPDAQITSLSIKDKEIIVGDTTRVQLTLANTGSYPLKEQTKINLYLDGKVIESIYLQQPLNPNETVTLERDIVAPEFVGMYRLYAIVNENRFSKELNYSNNASEVGNVQVNPSFTASIKTDKNVYTKDEIVLIIGNIKGKNIANANVDVYVINDNYKKVLNVTTSEKGDFEVQYSPQMGQLGHFIVGACYPNEGLHTEMASFDIYGLRRTDHSPIICETLKGESFEGKFSIKNPSMLPLSDVKIDVVSKPENCDIKTSIPNTIKAGETIDVCYSFYSDIASEGNSWKDIVLKITTKEGATLTTNLFYYCYVKTGNLVANIPSIQSTMVMGGKHDFAFTITNTGIGESGKITLSLPEWIKSITPREMPSLQKGESCEVILSFRPTDDMQINVPVIGSIGINCTNGQGLSLPFNIEPVSESTGTLTIDVCDELTYYTKEAPHIHGAKVTISHPTKGTLIASGITNEKGMYTIVVPEGFYSVHVTAENHDSYRNNILVDPGKNNKVIVNLSYNAITVDWDVKETEVRDEYKITTTVKYETNVPMPVVETIVPDRLDTESLANGESLIFNAILTNKGLVTAQDVSLELPANTKTLKFEPLANTEFINLAPQQSIMIPVKVTYNLPQVTPQVRVKAARSSDEGPCTVQTRTKYYWECGNDRKWHCYVNTIQVRVCRKGNMGGGSQPHAHPEGGGGHSAGGAGGVGSGPVGSALGSYVGGYVQPNIQSGESIKGCEPCTMNFLKNVALCNTGFSPVFGCAAGILSCLKPGETDATGCILSIVGCVPGTVGFIATVIGCGKSLSDTCSLDDPEIFSYNLSTNKKRIENLSASVKHSIDPSYLKEFKDNAKIGSEEITAVGNIFTEYFGDRVWIEKTSSHELENLLTAILMSESQYLNAESLMEYKPEQITKAQFVKFIERMNNTKKQKANGNVAGDNYVHNDVLKAELNVITESENKSKLLGYSSTQKMLDVELEKCINKAKDISTSVCASVTLHIDQTMVLTRQAFRGTLSVFNGNETIAMKDARLSLQVTDSDGSIATSHEFQINPESLEGFTGELNFESGWMLAAKTKGIANILFIPTKFAAPTIEKIYYFGGSFTYTDPYTGFSVTRDLSPVALTVKPSPVLDLTYFMQRDIMGDNPLTLDVVESMVPAEFALLINNKGNGDAENVSIVTEQPKIIENEKGLFVDFEILSSKVNGKDYALALGGSVESDFGTIPAHGYALGQWELQSTLLGHFIDYDVKATHVTSYGNKDLNLLDQVTIHELIHSFSRTNEDNTSVTGFLVNDIVDAEDVPDALYFSDGNIYDVKFVQRQQAKAIQKEDYKVELTIRSDQSGWQYGSISDPTMGTSKLIKVIRKSDNKELPLAQFWQTEYTLRDGRNPLHEYLIHYVDEIKFTQQGEIYDLYFEPYPEQRLQVEAFEMTPSENNLHVKPVETIKVKFNKPIRPETFTMEDLKIACQGSPLDLSQVTFDTVDNLIFTMNLGNTATTDGYYLTTVQTAGITDTEGYNGKDGKSIDWIFFLNGQLVIKAEAYPFNGGSVKISNPNAQPSRPMAIKETSVASGIDQQTVPFNEPVHFEATPAKGYKFNGWYIGERLVSNEPCYTTNCIDHTALKARFTNETVNVTIKNDGTNGVVVGVGSGKYDYGSMLEFKAIAATGYKLVGWMVNNKMYTADKNSSLVWTLKGDIEVEALFVSAISGSSIGDVNNDGAITVVDITQLNQYLLGQPVEGFHKENADINNDGTISVVDIAELTDIILNNKQYE